MLDLIVEVLAIVLLAFVCCGQFFTGWARKVRRRAIHRRATSPKAQSYL